MWPFRRKPSARDRRIATRVCMAYLLNDEAPLPSPKVQRWVNRTLGRIVFTEAEA